MTHCSPTRTESKAARKGPPHRRKLNDCREALLSPRGSYVYNNPFRNGGNLSTKVINRRMAFWKRKKEDRYITLGLNEPSAEPTPETASELRLEPPAGADGSAQAREPVAVPPAVEPVPTGAQPAPQPAAESGLTDARQTEVIETPRPAAAPAPVEVGQREQQTMPRAAQSTPTRPAPARTSSSFSSS